MDTNGTSISHRRFCTSNLGGTAIGTGIAADPHFSQVAVQAHHGEKPGGLIYPWLVVWNMLYIYMLGYINQPLIYICWDKHIEKINIFFPIQLGIVTQLTNSIIFQRGNRYVTNQV